MKLAALALMALPVPAHAETITFESDEEILIVRGRQTLDDARFELLGPRAGEILCVALNIDDKPLAVETAYPDSGFVRFNEIDINTISRVVCRYTMDF